MSYQKIIDDISKKVPQTECEEYLGDDGLLYCSKCKTPKQCRITVFGEEKIVPCICECIKQKKKEEEQERERIELCERIKKNRRIAFPESTLNEWTFENDDGGNEDITRIAKNYVIKFKEFKKRGKGLLLYGNAGSGKTFISACIANALLDKGHSALVTNFTRITNTAQGMFDGKQDYLDSLNQFELLVLDDLGVERRSEFMQESVFNIIDSRYRKGLPLIITTNLSLEEIKNAKDMNSIRIYDRILEMCHPIKVVAPSRRRKKVKETYSDIKELLGI